MDVFNLSLTTYLINILDFKTFAIFCKFLALFFVLKAHSFSTFLINQTSSQKIFMCFIVIYGLSVDWKHAITVFFSNYYAKDLLTHTNFNEKCTIGFERTSLSSSCKKRPTSTEAETRLSNTQKIKKDNKQPIGKHADS